MILLQGKGAYLVVFLFYILGNSNKKATQRKKKMSVFVWPLAICTYLLYKSFLF